MESKIRISPGQLVCLLTLSRLFTVLTVSAGLSADAAFITAVTTLAFQIPVMLLLLMICRRLSLMRYTVIRAALFAFYGFSAVYTAAAFVRFVSRSLSGRLYTSAAVLLLFAACALSAARGLEASARASVLFMWLAGLLLAAALLGLWGQYDPLSFSLPEMTLSKLLAGSLRGLYMNFELLLLPALLPSCEGFGARHGLVWLSSVALVSELLIFASVFTLGGYAEGKSYPLFSALASASFLSSGRPDAIFICIWVILGFVRMSVFLIAACGCLKCGRRRSGWRPAAALSAVLAVLTLFAMSGCSRIPEVSRQTAVTAVAAQKVNGEVRVALEYMSADKDGKSEYKAVYAGGRTFAEAVENARAGLGRTLLIDTCMVLVLPDCGRDELLALLSAIDGDGRIRPGTTVCLSDDLFGLMADADSGFAEQASDMLDDCALTLKDAIRLLKEPGRAPVLPVLSVSDGAVVIAGFAACSECSVPVGAAAVRLLPFFGDESRQRHMTVSSVGGSADIVLERVRVRAAVYERDGEPRFVLGISAAGSVGQQTVSGADVREEIADAAALELEKYAGQLVDTAVKKGRADIFSFGKLLSIRYPGIWKTLGSRWEDYLPDISCEVRADVKIR